MTITDANAVNVVLDRLLEAVTGEDSLDDRLVEAAAQLADKAYKTLGAGLTSGQVVETFGTRLAP